MTYSDVAIISMLYLQDMVIIIIEYTPILMEAQENVHYGITIR